MNMEEFSDRSRSFQRLPGGRPRPGRQELDHDYEATVGLATTCSKHAPATRIPSSSQI